MSQNVWVIPADGSSRGKIGNSKISVQERKIEERIIEYGLTSTLLGRIWFSKRHVEDLPILVIGYIAPCMLPYQVELM